MYITNEFAFNMIDISKVCYLNSTMIRVYPNIAQTSARKTSTIDSLTKFFIRPEDVMFYEPYVDVFEFYCPIKLAIKIATFEKNFPNKLKSLQMEAHLKSEKPHKCALIKCTNIIFKYNYFIHI